MNIENTGISGFFLSGIENWNLIEITIPEREINMLIEIVQLTIFSEKWLQIVFQFFRSGQPAV